jgi:hypothetical protein
MRDQYAGDVSDFVKFAFLRSLTADDMKLGVAWYYVPDHDGGPDGRHLEWRDDLAWKRLDPILHEGLSRLPNRSVAALQRASIWPNGTLFHDDPVPKREERNTWSEAKRRMLDDADVVFLDPDNGLGDSGMKHATYSEVRRLRKPGRSIVFISFPGRSSHQELVEQLHQRLVSEADADRMLTMRTNVSVPRAPGSPYVVQRQRWFTIVDPSDTLVDRTRVFAEKLASLPRVRTVVDLRG